MRTNDVMHGLHAMLLAMVLLLSSSCRRGGESLQGDAQSPLRTPVAGQFALRAPPTRDGGGRDGQDAVAGGSQGEHDSASGRGIGDAPLAYPDKAVAIYVAMWRSSGAPPLASLPPNTNVVNLAFAQGDPPALVGWSAQGESSFLADAKAMRARGVRMVVSVGGLGGAVHVSNRQAFADGIMAIHARLPLDGLDWDVEDRAMTKSDIVWISTELKRRRGAEFAITMAPKASNQELYLDIAVALHAAGALDAIGQQFYDEVVSQETARTRINAMMEAGIPESKIGVGMMVGDANVYWTVDECVAAVSYLKERYPGLRGGYLWKHGRPGTAEWARRVGPILLR